MSAGVHKPDPMHGVTLKMVLDHLVLRLGWERMAKAVDIRCFKNDPSVQSSLVFLRRTPWARKEVEGLYLRSAPKADPKTGEGV